ncbi:hypothetical protein B0H10DRAFT_1948895 [Mycena sp. CBHHK59/15]|nr:hypothetical protein B0H10DRAFT_1948895 [Mycena sp. CBHHK59/15]
MQQSTRLQNLIQYVTLAASTANEIASAAKVPFLRSTAVLSLSILECVQAVKSNKEACIRMTEEIHEILCAIISLYSMSEIDGVLPPVLLHDIAKFTQTLEKICTFMKAQQGMGKIKQLLKHADNLSRLEACQFELGTSLNNFRIGNGIPAVAAISKMQTDAKKHHEELLALLAAHPELTNSDWSSAVSGNWHVIRFR